MGKRHFNLEKGAPVSRGEKEKAHQIQRIKRIIEGEEKVPAETDLRLDKAVKILKVEGIVVDKDELLLGALEMLWKEWGGLPDKKMMARFIALKEKELARKIAEASGPDDFYELLGKLMTEAGKNHLDLDRNRVEGFAWEMFAEKEAA